MQVYAPELDRLKYQHQVLTNHFGALALAPVDFSKPSLRILDSDTADGLWLRKLCNSHSGSDTNTYIGTDIVADFFPPPASLPPTLNLQVQSITEQWSDSWRDYFDYVHRRSVLVGAGDPGSLKGCVDRLVELVTPGGWIELIEADLTDWNADDKFENGPVVKKFVDLCKRILDGPATVGHAYSKSLKAWLLEQGLEEVREEVYNVPWGIECVDEAIIQPSIDSLRMAVEGLISSLSEMPPLGISGEDLKDLPDKIAQELRERGARLKWIAVWARKADGN